MNYYSDSAGNYYGETNINIPHGKGKKVYANNLIYEGEWKQGRKHGKGIIKTSNEIFALLWNEGLPTKIIKIINLENNYKSINTLEINIFPVQYGDYYAEICDTENSKKYYFYLDSYGNIAFKGRLFTTPLKNFKNILTEELSYTGETKDYSPFGYAHMITDYFDYIGYNNYLILEGQGTKMYRNGIIYKGYFVDDFLNGEGEIINGNSSIIGTFYENKPVGEVLVTINEKINYIYINWDNGRLGVRCNSELKDILKEIIGFIEISMIIYDDIHLKFIDGEIFYDCYKNMPRRIKDKEKKYDFKGYKNWKVYESENLMKNINLVQLTKEENGIYSGEMVNGIKNGKGKMIFINNEVYNGEWKNGKIEGYGKLYYKNGDYYIGCFTNGVRSGFGKFFSAEFCYFGYWKDDKFNGKGRLKFSCREISGIFDNGNLIIGLY
ncbi:hypothetical protein SteCoe_10391 [Stentor coeruleus]|uniref:MORN repeat-containing protein n=1 Tax=Stentor coeruleus TaxID=5963 RepID=A0A1R2CFM4_9CILI|nr:hypothetical protein SteCoe_10391 [Stentor coeruleus]